MGLQFSSNDTVVWQERYGSAKLGTGSLSGTEAPIDTYITGTSGSSSLSSWGSMAGFAAGDIVLIQQITGTTPGHWQFNVLTNTSGGLKYPLQANFSSSGENRAYMRVCPEFGVVNINSTFTAKAWDRTTREGGIIAIFASVTNINATISARGKGHIYGETNQTGGEEHGHRGFGEDGTDYGRETNAVDNGGGGGGRNFDTPGGGHGGSNRTQGTHGQQANGQAGTPGKIASSTSTDGTKLGFGGAGGNGGTRHTPTQSGRGGEGGGGIIIISRVINQAANIDVRGNNGLSGVGYGGGGAGGAGGFFLAKCQVFNRISGSILQTGGTGGSGANAGNGGNGGAGLARIEYSAVQNATSDSTLYTAFDPILADQGGAMLFDFV